MLWAGVLFVLVAVYAASAGWIAFRLGLDYRQSLLYLPLRLFLRIDDRDAAEARRAEAPVIYVIVHQSRLDAAMMLALLPSGTLHILDPESARAPWLEPWRELARTIAFNAEHMFVSRRLVRHLRGRGRLAVYVPDAVEPDARAFRLFRAVARIAVKAGASVVPIVIDGSRHLPGSYTPASIAPRRLGKLRIAVLPPVAIPALIERAGMPTTAANALFDYVAEARYRAGDAGRGLFEAVVQTARLLGPGRIVVEDPFAGSMSYRRLLTGARIVGARLAAATAPGEAVGVMLPTSNALAVALLGLASAMRVAAMVNYTAGEANVTAAIRTATIRTVISSRAFVEKAGLQEIVAAAERGGAKVLWLEDVQATIGGFDKAVAALMWRSPVARQSADADAVILFTSGSEGLPKAVPLTHANLLANIMQIRARIDFSPRDTLFNILPAFHSFGLTGGTILPLVTGVRLFLYPSPLHYKLIPEMAAKVRPTILFGTDTFLRAYARHSRDGDFASLRLVVAGAEPVREETRRIWRERFGAELIEGYGMTEAAPVVAVNSATHGRAGTVGRLLPGMQMRLEPVEGVAAGGRLWIAGPNVMTGYIDADRPGERQAMAERWHDTGDIVTVDRDGFITISGRAKRFAKIAGEMISLGAVEMLVQALWPEQNHAVVTVPDRRRGERIVLVTTAADADAATLRRHGRKLGASELMVPQDIVPVTAIPLLGTGKIDYPAARAVALGRLGHDQAA